MNRNALDKLIFYKPEQCDSCGGVLEYKGIGRYICISCGKELLDDYGTVKEYFRSHGPTPLHTVVKDTGISKDKIKYIVDGNYKDIPTADPRALKRAFLANNLKNKY